MEQILVVDDDPHIRKLVNIFFSKEGFAILEAADGEEALIVLATHRIACVILDVMMPRMDGWELCRELRTYYADMFPILMLTAKGETKQKVKGFELGADDYLVKPFDPVELVARVKVLLKRYNALMSNKLQIGNIELDRSTYGVMCNQEKMTLPPKEFELLLKLATHPSKTFAREQLIEDIWGFDYEGDERTVDVHIKRLRQRLADKQVAFQINTIRGLGYRLELDP